jgi:hypothetical protein
LFKAAFVRKTAAAAGRIYFVVQNFLCGGLKQDGY